MPKEKDPEFAPVPSLEEAINLLSTSGGPTFEGDVASIYHPQDTPWCISKSRRSVVGMPDNNWSTKIRNSRQARIETLQNASLFTRLFVPEVYWADDQKAIAAIEWVQGVSLDSHPPQDKFLYRKLEQKTEGVIQYLQFLDLIHKKGKVFADHKPSSIVSVWSPFDKENTAGWRYGLVDVQLVEPETGSLPNNIKTKWEIELGHGGANNVNGDELDKTLLSFYKYSLTESETKGRYKYLMPVALRNFVSRLFTFDTAGEAAATLADWRNGQSTKIDARRDQLEEVLDSPILQMDKGSRFSAMQKDARTIVSEKLARKQGHSDLYIAQVLSLLEELSHE